jgi:2-dehydro-3-deoxyphosphogalactonate aldolase
MRQVLPVGGITPDNLAEWWAAGARGFGIGSALFKPGMTVQQVAKKADAFVANVRKSMANCKK